MLFRDITVIDASFAALEHQYLLVEGERITHLGPNAPENYHGPIYEGAGKLAMPGFVNSHCHVPMGALRGYGEGLPLDRWLFERIFPFEAIMTDDDMYWGTLLGIAEMLACGVCAFTDMYMHMASLLQATDESGIKANLSHSTSSDSAEEPFTATNGWRGMQTLLTQTKAYTHGRIVADLGLHAEYTSFPRAVRDMAEFAKANNLHIHLHLSETQKEHEDCKARHGLTPTAYFESHGVLDVPVVAAHCVWLEDADFDILARHNATISYNPSSNLKLGSGIAPVKTMLQRGIRVAVGTDGASSNNNLNMLEELHIGALVQKGFNHEPDFLSTAQLLQMATQNGALAQGRADCGCLKVGNRADIAVFNLEKPHIQPIYDAATSLIYSAQGSDCCLTMVDGKILYQDGIYHTLDVERILFESRKIRDSKLAMLSGR